MDLLQIHETMITTRGRASGELEFLFLSVSSRMLDQSWGKLLRDPTELLKTIDLSADSTKVAIAELPQVLLALLSTGGEDSGHPRFRDAKWIDSTRERDPELAGFAEYLAFADVVPFEQSDMKGQSLAGLAVKSASSVAGALGAAAKVISTAPAAVAAIPAIAPFAPVALYVIVGGVGAVTVIDGIGVVCGIVSSPSTQNAANRIRAGLRRLLRRK